MGKIIFGLGLAALIILGLVWTFDPYYKQQRADAAIVAADRARVAANAEATQTALRLQEQQQHAQIAAQQATATAPVWTGTTITLIVLIPIVAALGVVAGGFFLYRRYTFIRPDAQGRLPVRHDDVLYGATARAALGLFHEAQIARASIAAVPTNYAPHITYAPQYRNEQRTLPGEIAGNPVLELADVLGVPSFAQLLDQGRIGKGRPMLLGFDTEGQPVEASFKSLFSAGVGGLQGSGKTWSTVNIIAQSVLSGARLAICDLHAGDEESLATRLEPLSSALLFGVADSTKSITTAVQNVDAILTRRKEGDKDRSLIILAFDEYTSTLRRLGKDGDAMSDMIANLTSEGRKYGIFCLLLAQNWGAESTGGSEVRNTLASALIHRIRPAEARMLTGMTADSLPKDTLQLAPGEFYLMDTHGDMTKVAAPRITAADVVRVAGLLTDTAPTIDRLQPEIAQDQPLISQLLSQDVANNQSRQRSDYSASQRNTALTPDEAKIVRLFLEGKDAGAIVTEITDGWTSKKGAPYIHKLTEVQATIRKALAGAA